MKKRLYLCLTALALLLCACGKSEKTAIPDPEDFEVLERREIADFDRTETERMINLMGGNRALVLNGTLYTLDYDAAYRPVLARYELTGDGLGERTVLAEDCLPVDLTELDGRLYYINGRAEGGAIESIGPEGEDRQTVREGGCSFLQVKNGALYFCDEEGRFCRVRPDGGGEQVILGERCFYPWLSDGWVLYQSDGDGERLHLRWLDDGTDIRLTDRAGFAPVAVAGRLYYSGEGRFMSMGLDGLGGREHALPGLLGAAEVFPAEEGCALRWVEDENGPAQYTAELNDEGDGKLRPASAELRGYRLCDFIGGGYRVDAWYNPDGRIRCFVLCFPDGTEADYMGEAHAYETEEAPA